MFIKSLSLKNFKAIKNVEIDFAKINLISGEPGQGKSAVLDAIVYAITDYLEENISDYVRWSQKEFSIALNFNHLNKEYDCLIEGAKGAKKALVINGDTKNKFLNKDATSELKSIIDPVITLYSNVSLQAHTNSLLFDKPSPRLEKHKIIFGLNDIGTACSSMKEDASELKLEIELVQRDIDNLLARKYVYHDIPELQDETELQNELEKLEIQKAKNAIEAKAFSDFLNAMDRYSKAVSSIDDLLYENEEKQKLIDVIEILPLPDFDENDYLSLQQQISDKEKEQIQYNNEVENFSKIKKRIIKVRGEISQKEKEIESHPLRRLKKPDKSKEDIVVLDSELNILKSNALVLDTKLELSEAGKCPTCGQDFIASPEEIKKELDELDTKIKDLCADIVIAESELEKYLKAVTFNETNRFKRDQLQKTIDSLTEELNELLEHKEPEEKDFQIELDVLSTSFDTMTEKREQVSKIKTANDVNNKKKQEIERQILINSTRITELEKVIKPNDVEPPTPFDNTHYTEVRDAVTIYNQKKAEVDRLEDINATTKIEEKENNKKIEENQQFIETANIKVRLFDEARRMLEKDFSGYLISTGTEFIRKKMNKFFKKVYNDYYIVYENDGKGISFRYTPDHVNYSEINMASGFEKDLISIANRVALTSIQNIGIMMLDEVDKYASTNQALRLFEILFAENFSQYFIISHSDSVKEWISLQPQARLFEIKNGEIL